MSVSINHKRIMPPDDGKYIVITDIEFHNYRDSVATECYDEMWEGNKAEIKAHADNVFKLMDRLALAYCNLDSRVRGGIDEPKLIGWRMADYTAETADPEQAKNWSANVKVLPIFEGDPNTKLSEAKQGDA
jgi:hypothetical protein